MKSTIKSLSKWMMARPKAMAALLLFAVMVVLLAFGEIEMCKSVLSALLLMVGAG